MIQRIQTLWMALTAALVGVVLAMPVLYFSVAGAQFSLMNYGVKCTSGEVLVDGGVFTESTLVAPVLSVSMAVLLAMAALLPFASIFLYKKRGVQLRMLVAELVLLLGSAALMGYYVWKYYRLAGEFTGEVYFSFFPLLIVIAMLTTWFAIRGVMRDEMLVRAADRIR